MSWRGLPRAVWLLGLVSLFMDLSSETIHALLPAFLAVELGVGTVALGLLDGASEAIASSLKIVSGAWSDRTGNRKRLAVIGYALSAASKPLFVIAGSLWPVACARAIDRVGKGIRGAPRDALITDVTPAEVRGAAFGLRQALDTIGAVLGPLLAMAWMLGSSSSYRGAFAIAVIPALVAVSLLAFGVREPERAQPQKSRGTLRWRELVAMPKPVWLVLALAALLTLGRATEAFLVLVTLDRGLAVELSPLALVAMNVVYSAIAYPAGGLADRMPHRRLLAIAAALLVGAQLVLALSGGLLSAFAGIVLFGVHLAFSQGLLSAWIAAVAPTHARATAFGMLHLANGIATIAAGAIAGIAWALHGPQATFAIAAGFAALTLVCTLLVARGE